jgi:NAD+ diphosphatase
LSSDEHGVYLFQGYNLLIPENIPDTVISGLNSRESVQKAFKTTDFFDFPSINSEERIFEADISPDEKLPSGWRSLSVREGLSIITGGNIADGAGEAGRLLRAYHISQWRRDSRFCSVCGTPNTDAPDELARLCPACGRREYPRVAPAVITIIINDKNEALLAHNHKFADGVYSLIAGFNEAGESLEATVAREIREEVSLEVRDIRYLASQPWPFPQALMVGFTARHAGGEIHPDGVEIEDAQWFSRDRLPKLPAGASISRLLINNWISGAL